SPRFLQLPVISLSLPILPHPPTSTLFPYTTLFRSNRLDKPERLLRLPAFRLEPHHLPLSGRGGHVRSIAKGRRQPKLDALVGSEIGRSTRLNSSHVSISYAVFCLKKKKKKHKKKYN